jgi:hypothetical protein
MIVHSIILVIFLILTTLIIVFKLNNILMQKLNLSLYFRNIFVIMTNILIIKINNNNKQIISIFQYTYKSNRKDHTASRTSYNKS